MNFISFTAVLTDLQLAIWQLGNPQDQYGELPVSSKTLNDGRASQQCPYHYNLYTSLSIEALFTHECMK